MDHFVIYVCVCQAFLSVHCSLVAKCWKRAGHLALLYVISYCVFVTFPSGVLGQVCYLIVLYDFLVAVKAAPHECVIRTGQP